MKIRKFSRMVTLPIFLYSAITCATGTFMNPVTTAQLTNCEYDDLTCAGSTHHAGIDYSRHGDHTVVASNAGTVVKIENMHANDHGMGNNVIIGHELENGNIIYSSYSHLSSISTGLRVGQTVIRGEEIGEMGGSGYGNANHWGVHLHFELKESAVSGAPTASTSYWGYVPSDPDDYGYFDPNDYIGIENVVQPLTSGQTEYNFIPQNQWHYYRINTGDTNLSTITIELTQLSDDADLYVQIGEKPLNSNVDCSSYNGGTTSETCTLTLSSSAPIYIGVHGYRGSNYAVKATLANSETSIPLQYIDSCIIKYFDYFGNKTGSSYTCYSNYLCQDTTGGSQGDVIRIAIHKELQGNEFYYNWGGWSKLSLDYCN